MDEILDRLVQVGNVTDVDRANRRARVKFNLTGITSDWLQVVINQPFIPDYDTKPQRTEFTGGGSGDAAFENHKHDLIIKPWLPKVNDTVLVLYLPVKNGDGYILGGI